MLHLVAAPARSAVRATSRPKIGLALSGGGAKGLAHIGVLKVLEEKGITVDCIAGTSMGAVIGGLYAIGYDAERLEAIARAVNWNDLLLDPVPRRALSMPEKEEDGKYMGLFPIFGRRVELPSGLIPGQKLLALLNRLTWSVHENTDFSGFPIPFRCVAADIGTGEAVVLKSGHLAAAIRASMAIPTAFTPVEMDGRLLVDGGIVRNFPVSDVRDMGADIVIGVDVYTPRTPPDATGWDMARIVNQAVSLVNVTTVSEQRRQCDILIDPDLEGYNLFSFDSVDSLIAAGERAARRVSGRLDSLAARLSDCGPAPGRPSAPPADRAVRVTSLAVEGLRRVSRKLVVGRLMLNLPKRLTADDIDAAVEKVYGSGFFKRVSYRLKERPYGSQLVVEVQERSLDEIRFGLHYDSDNETALLFNLTLRNRLGDGSRQLFDARLGRHSGFRAAFFTDIGWDPGLTFGSEYRFQEWTQDEYGGERLDAQYGMRLIEADGRLEGLVSNSLSFGLSAFYRRILKKPSWLPADEEWPDAVYRYGGLTAFFKRDDLDRLVFPRRGTRLYLEYREAPEFINDDAVFRQFTGSIRHTEPIAPRLAFLTDGWVGWIQQKRAVEEQVYRIGGLPGPGLNFIPFPGLVFMSRSGRSAAAFRAGLRIEPREMFFLSAELGYLRTGMKMEELLKGGGEVTCWSVSAGLLTPFGPLQWAVSGRFGEEDLLSRISLGYEF
jgi:NTE family protein